MAKYATVFLPYATGATSGTSVAGSWINVENMADIVCQVVNRKGFGSAVATTPSCVIVVEGTFDDAHLDGSTVGFFRLGSQAITTIADMSLLMLSTIGEVAGVVAGPRRFPIKWMRAKITTIEQGTPTVMLRGLQMPTDNAS